MKTNSLSPEERIARLEAELRATQAELQQSRTQQKLESELAATRMELQRERQSNTAAAMQRDQFVRQREPGLLDTVFTGLAWGAGFSIADNIIDDIFG